MFAEKVSVVIVQFHDKIRSCFLKGRSTHTQSFVIPVSKVYSSQYIRVFCLLYENGEACKKFKVYIYSVSFENMGKVNMEPRNKAASTKNRQI